MTELLLCGTCLRACLWTEIDRLGRVYWRHPTYPCVSPPPAFFHECVVCEDEVKLHGPYRLRQVVLCGDECRRVHEMRAKVKKQKARKWAKELLRLEEKQRRRDERKLHLEGGNLEIDVDAKDVKERRSA